MSDYGYNQERLKQKNTSLLEIIEKKYKCHLILAMASIFHRLQMIGLTPGFKFFRNSLNILSPEYI